MGNAKKMSVEEYAKYKAAAESAEASGILDIDTPDTGTATCAMLGAGYELGNIIVPQIRPSTLTLLSVAGISLVTDPDEEGDGSDGARDLIVSLFIICHPEACQMIMGAKQRLIELKKLEHLASKSPDMFDRYMDKIDAIGGGAYTQLEQAAYAFVDGIDGFTYQAAFSVISQMFNDLSTPMGLLPASDDNGKKK